MSFWGIVPAAGIGRRFGARKQEVRLGDRPLWAWARDALMVAGAIDVVVVGPVPGGVAGGPRRRDSVAAGLEAVPRMGILADGTPCLYAGLPLRPTTERPPPDWTSSTYPESRSVFFTVSESRATSSPTST